MDSYEASANGGDGRTRVGRGGKVRSETVTVRLDPKLRYLADLAGRKQRRTLSSFIEWAIEESLSRVTISEHYDDRGNNYVTSLGEVGAQLWDVDAPDRFVKLALKYPDLLTHEEQLLWKLIRSQGVFWKGTLKNDEWTYKTDDESWVSFRNLRTYWDLVNQVARGIVPETELPRPKVKGANASNTPTTPIADDGDLPF